MPVLVEHENAEIFIATHLEFSREFGRLCAYVFLSERSLKFSEQFFGLFELDMGTGMRVT